MTAAGGGRDDKTWTWKEKILLTELASHESVYTTGNYQEGTSCLEWQDWEAVSQWLRSQVAFRRKPEVAAALFNTQGCKEMCRTLLLKHSPRNKLPQKQGTFKMTAAKALQELRKYRMAELEKYLANFQNNITKEKQVIQLVQQGSYDTTLRQHKQRQQLQQAAAARSHSPASNSNASTPAQSRPSSTTPANNAPAGPNGQNGMLSAQLAAMSRAQLQAQHDRFVRELQQREQSSQKQWHDFANSAAALETQKVKELDMKIQRYQRSGQLNPQQQKDLQRQYQVQLQQIRAHFQKSRQLFEQKNAQTINKLRAMIQAVKVYLDRAT